jgi:hypothetical protein
VTDSSLRSLERLAGDDPAAAARLAAEELRAQRFRRDPRLDPRRGDQVEVDGVVRSVSRVWPRCLWRDVPALNMGAPLGADGLRPSTWLRAGQLVDVMESTGQWVAFRAWVGPLASTSRAWGAGSWIEFRALADDLETAEPRMILPAAEAAALTTPITTVEYYLPPVPREGRSSRPGRYKDRAVSLDSWTRWARRGRVTSIITET